ncbi:MAG TPA: glycosyltransferase family 2 protein [Parapedobacter sp.]|uniref:glycosyltransferase family 2 protein n=1 Tax=Parapedobacter sp. TaxID=1958893 RepID=UPI002CFD10D2|nr:glycosyltransferase family 2 protein [Parapedobacter sp.]HWK56125.1 glycosyltransferase family 2 protein [Parapedobacter sp.]
MSVVIPAYNEEKGILKTLSSLSDTATDFPTEIIVVDNNSSDETKNLILQAGAIYLFEEKQGVKNARNCGLDYARGRYIINGDADTIYSPYWINSLIKPLVNDETIAVAYGKFAFIPEPGYTRLSFFFYETIGDIFKRVQGNLKDKAMYIYGCSSAYRKTQGIAVDRYEHPPGANEDGYLGLKLRNRFGKLQQIKQPKSLAWTSSRKFITDGSLLNRIIKKFRRSF